MTGEDQSPVTPLDANGPAAPAPARFCTSCGGELPGDGTGCAACAARSAQPALSQPSAEVHGPLVGALSLYFTLLAAQVVGFVIAVLGGESDATAVRVDLVVSTIMSITVFTWVVARRGWVVDGLRTVGAGRWYLLAAGLAPVTFTVATAIIGAAHAALDVEVLSYAEPFLATGLGWGVIVLMIAVQPAVIEELAFRGVIQGALARVLNVREAVLVAAMLFTILHLAPLSFPHLLLVGVAAGLLRVRSGSLYPPMLLHFLHNFMVIGEEWWRLG